MQTRFIIQHESEEDCPDCAGTDRAHKRYTIRYTLPDGTPVEPRVGDVYFTDHRGKYSCAWTNCDGKHLHCLVPSTHGFHPWNIDGRASNCTMKEETTHRCWVRHGDPSVPGQLHVDKNGHTCGAGAGSILVDGYHGFLHHGELKP